ncbi:nitrous oxide-stimulated promoter family protein [Alkalibacter mobilis]|uniref:nitrous oxide-stimulated promoter family protein n=1 Tax=Alkalibacter mobilis TaxID=2787712 RepID=UPI00189EF670|nr:nitrous oxide-stimulated promoter family protein [Alkalibacter mobilis]
MLRKYGKDKSVRNKCKARCYRSEVMDETKEVMRRSGMRIILYHSGMPIMHMY